MPASSATSVLLAWTALSGTAPDEHLPLPPARQEIVFAADTTEVTLDRLLAEFARATGQELAMDRKLVRALEGLRVPLASTDPVPPDEVYAFVEGHLATHGIWIAPLKAGTRPVLGLADWKPSPDGTRLLEPVAVSIAQLDEAAAHPALLVSLLVSMRNTDSRLLPKQLRTALTDPEHVRTQAVPCGERTLLLMGRASSVVDIARRVLEMDEAAGRDEPEPPSSEGGQ